MKNILAIIALSGCGVLFGASCEHSGTSEFYVGNDNGTFNIATHYNANYACPDLQFSNVVGNNGPYGVMPQFSYAVDPSTITAIRNNILTGVIDYALWGQILMNDSHWFPDLVSINVNIGGYITGGGIFQPGSQSSSGHYYFAFFFPKQKTFNYGILCGSTMYNKLNMFNFPNYGSNMQLQQEEYDFSTGNDFDFYNNISFTPNGNINQTVTYTAKVHWPQHAFENIRIKKSWTVPLRNILPPDWIGAPVGLNSLSNDVYISPNYIESPVYPIVYELFGNGVYLNGQDWLFSPVLAGDGNHVISYRTQNQGCFSNWIDTIFPVANVVNNIVGPEIDYNQVFNVPFSNLLYGPNYLRILKTSVATLDSAGNYVPGVSEDPLFHYVCSNSEYNLVIKNPDPDLTYEWMVLYENQEYATGTGDEFLLITPDRETVSIDTYWGSSDLDNYVHGDDYGYFILYDGRISNYLGEPMKVYVRSKNVLNNYSPWEDHYLGVVRRPENNVDDLLFCHDVGVPVVFDSLSSTPIYLSYFDVEDVRKIRLNYDMNLSWDYTGDSTSYLPTTLNKTKNILVQTVDSTKVYGRTLELSGYQWGISYSGHGEVCYSDIDTLTIIKKPDFDVSFSEVGSLVYGTPVQGVISGDYYVDSVSNYAWQWNDGSETYNDDTLWHFLNDLGSYSLSVSVIDQYGCSSTNYYDSVWFVPGYLGAEQVDVVSLKIYPNPSNGIVKYVGIDNVEEIYVVNYLGQKIDVKSSFDGEINMVDLPAGNYLLFFINEDGVVYKHKIVKI